jgi:predicted Zn-dependent protease with MMP-like domain
MKPTTLMVCKGLISPERQGVLVPLLSRDDQVMFQQLPVPTHLTREHLKWDLLQHIHFTWLAPYLRTLAEQEIRLFLAVVSPVQAHGLQSLLGFGNELPSLSKIAKEALRHFLLNQVKQEKELVPFAFLPEHPLNHLLQYTSEQIGKLILYLGLHDLSFEMRQIIDTRELKKIFEKLTKKEGEFLNALMLYREPLIFQRLFLKKWDGSKEKLHKILQERGAHRLGHVLYDASESLTWYLTHALDMHIGATVLKCIEKPSHARAGEILLGQIRKIEAFFKLGDSK